MGRCLGVKIIIVDDVLSKFQINEIVTYYDENPDKLIGNWYTEPLNWQLDLLLLAGEYFNLKDQVGFESWGHITSRPDWHIDQDELAEQNGLIERPLCSIVYYPHVRLIRGGFFLTETEIIKPKTNRAIIFSSGIEHSVEPWEGERISVAINPWSFLPYTYRHK